MELAKRQKVSASMTDSRANLSVSGIFQLVEDAVTELMGELKIDGLTAKREYNAVWVFVKNRIKFLKSVAWNEEIVIRSFVSAKSRASISIDVTVKNKTGDICAYARVLLCALDLQSGRIRKVDTVGVGEQVAVAVPEFDVRFAKIPDTDLPEAASVQVGYTSIDFSRHTNNKAYVRFILDTYSVSQLESKRIEEMEVIYVNQSYENDVLTIRKGSFGTKDIVVLQCGDKVVVKSEILFAS